MATNLLQKMGQEMSDALQSFLLMMAPDHKGVDKPTGMYILEAHTPS